MFGGGEGKKIKLRWDVWVKNEMEVRGMSGGGEVKRKEGCTWVVGNKKERKKKKEMKRWYMGGGEKRKEKKII